MVCWLWVRCFMGSSSLQGFVALWVRRIQGRLCSAVHSFTYLPYQVKWNTYVCSVNEIYPGLFSGAGERREKHPTAGVKTAV
ncbi:hypothetical protein GGR51DRAFT_526569 [Nemania sp. FL0031]|nr:hypothetical protein GGR51DRAFT_526569 [Nemania sp. FL0031]